RFNNFFTCRGVSFTQFHVDVTISYGAGAMTGIIADMFPRPKFHILRNTRMAQPVNGGGLQLLRVVGETFFLHCGNRAIETLLNDATNLTRAGNAALSAILMDQGSGVARRRQLTQPARTA